MSHSSRKFSPIALISHRLFPLGRHRCFLYWIESTGEICAIPVDDSKECYILGYANSLDEAELITTAPKNKEV